MTPCAPSTCMRRASPTRCSRARTRCRRWRSARTSSSSSTRPATRARRPHAASSVRRRRCARKCRRGASCRRLPSRRRRKPLPRPRTTIWKPTRNSSPWPRPRPPLCPRPRLWRAGLAAPHGARDAAEPAPARRSDIKDGIGFMNITADAVKQLRERTGAGMMECKKALVETKGDLDAAAELMRKQGLTKADKKASRIAAEGVIVIERSEDGRTAAMAEVNCETDFVARGQDFRTFAQEAAARALATRPASLEALLATRLSGGETLDERRRALVAKIGENIGVRRFVVLAAPGHLGAYVHGTRIGALVAIEGGDEALARDLAMHV